MSCATLSQLRCYTDTHNLVCGYNIVLTTSTDLKIGYVPYDSTLSWPADRRRFVHYAHARGLRFEIADPAREYDVVVVTSGGDISRWNRYPKTRTKIIYDQVDAYLDVDALAPRSMLRGVAKYLVGQNHFLLLNYSEGLRAMCSRADVVLCTTEAQRQSLLKYCDNVLVALDCHSELCATKQTYHAGPVFNLVWEGLGANLKLLSGISAVLSDIQKRHDIALHLITQLEYGTYLGGIVGKRHATRTARQLFDCVYLYQWNTQLVSAIIAACDLALIPIPPGNPLTAGKCANKLFLFWRMGLPTITSATTAYSTAMRQAGLDMCCRTSQEWIDQLEYYITHEDARKAAGCTGKAYVDRFCTEELMLSAWDEAFALALPQ